MWISNKKGRYLVMRVIAAALVVIAIASGALAVDAYRPHHQVTTRGQQDALAELRYQNCILRAIAGGAPNSTGLLEDVDRDPNGDAYKQSSQLVQDCKRP